MSKSTNVIKMTTITLALVMAASVSIGIAAQRGTMMDQNTTTTQQGEMMNQQGDQPCLNNQHQNGNGKQKMMMNQRGGMMNRGNMMNQGNGVNSNSGK